MFDKEKLMRTVRTWGFALIALGVALSCSIEPAHAQGLQQREQAVPEAKAGEEYFLVLIGSFTLPNGQRVASSVHLRVPSAAVCTMMMEWPHLYFSYTPYKDDIGEKVCMSASEHAALFSVRST